MKQSPNYYSKRTKKFKNAAKILPKKSSIALEKRNIVTKEYLKELATGSYKNPVISLYISSKTKYHEGTNTFTNIFNALKIDELKKRSYYISQLSHDQAKNLKDDLEDIENFLQDENSVQKYQSLVLFKSNDELKISSYLSLELDTNMLIIDINPYTSPLNALLQEQKKVCIVNLDKHETKFYLYENGIHEELFKIPYTTPNEDVDNTRPEKIDLHKFEHIQTHFKECADFIYKHAMKNNFEYLFVIGHEEISTKKFIHFLHPQVAEKLIESATISPLDFTKDTIPHIMPKILENHEIALEEKNAAELAQAKGQHSIIEGIEQVLSAHNQGLLRELYLQGDYKKNGYACPERHYIVLENGHTCPICKKNLLQVQDCIDELKENALANNIKIHLFLKKREIMEDYQRIAGITYGISS